MALVPTMVGWESGYEPRLRMTAALRRAGRRRSEALGGAGALVRNLGTTRKAVGRKLVPAVEAPFWEKAAYSLSLAGDPMEVFSKDLHNVPIYLASFQIGPYAAKGKVARSPSSVMSESKMSWSSVRSMVPRKLKDEAVMNPLSCI